MNEQIKQLAEQAGFVFWGEEDWNPGDEIDWSCRYDDEFKKFAELMVREHLKVLQQRWYELNNQEPAADETPRDIGMRVGAKSEIIFLIEHLKKHFDIE